MVFLLVSNFKIDVKDEIAGLTMEIPEPSLAHLERMTDDTGLFQHAKFIIPERENGYTTDDNARAIIVMTKYYAQYPQQEALKLLDKYLSFVLHAQNEDGTVRNFMNFDRSWQKNEPDSCALGRVLWAYGAIMASPPGPAYLSISKERFDMSLTHLHTQHPRSIAYSIMGMCGYLKQFSADSDIKRQLQSAADYLMDLYKQNSSTDWQWFEDVLTYDNAILPYALFAVSLTLDNKKYLEVANKACEFLLANTYNGDHFSFIGSNGWYERGKIKAQFDQQPIEAASTVMMLRGAYDATQRGEFLTLQRRAFDWFLGKNDLNMPLYDFRTKGCSDGLMSIGANPHQGAESIISFLMSLLSIIETSTSNQSV